ncbi:hypothetical protein [Pseudochrobactrum asaccharolyticum]|nr:hypothetical protein [Pseudochrobactrum asaccharolyticum]
MKSVAAANRMKMGLSAKVAGTQEAGSVLGRLHLLNPDEITSAQFEAGMRMAEGYARSMLWQVFRSRVSKQWISLMYMD